MKRMLQPQMLLAIVLLLLSACGLPAQPAAVTTALPAVTAAPAIPPATAVSQELPGGLSAAEFATLDSLRKVADYPLYTMRYTAVYDRQAQAQVEAPAASAQEPGWACSLFAALADPQNGLFGRNFDWHYSPVVLLFTDPPDGYASVSMVDIAYLVDAEAAGRLDELPVEARTDLLDAPQWPFDGMNEHGLAVGIAAVPPGNVTPDPDKENINSLSVIRLILDTARDVDEAVAILQSHNIRFGGGPPLHYLVADRSGRAALVEFSQGEIVVIPNEQPWQAATNFLQAEAGDSLGGECWRYDKISAAMETAGGRLGPEEAVSLLGAVSQPNTQWSVVYGLHSGQIAVALGGEYGEVFEFGLRMGE